MLFASTIKSMYQNAVMAWFNDEERIVYRMPDECFVMGIGCELVG